MNPDGFEAAVEGKCNGIGRENAHHKDLNRNFPDQFLEPEWIHDNKIKDGHKLEKETEAMIQWILNSHFVLSLNLHAGSEVASYPYDSGPPNAKGQYTGSPDDLFFKHLASTYADNHLTMSTMDGKGTGYFCMEIRLWRIFSIIYQICIVNVSGKK